MLRAQKETLPPVNEIEQSSAEAFHIRAKSLRPELRQRSRSARPYSAIRTNLRDELRMRFWSLQPDTAQNETEAAAGSDAKDVSPASPSSSAGAAPEEQAARADCEYLASCKDWPRMRERLLQRMTDSAAQEASQSAQEPGPPGTPTCAEAPSKQWLSGGTTPSVGSCSGVSVEESPSTSQPKDRAGQKEAWNAAGRLPVRWRQIAPAGVLLLMLLLLAFSGPAWRGSHLEVNLAISVEPRGYSKLCQPCASSCRRLADTLPGRQDLMWTGQPMACRGGFCVPVDAPAEVTRACLGDWGSLWQEEKQPEAEEESLGSRRGRRLLVMGSQRQLAHVGREQVRLLNKWTRTFAARLALESDSPPAANTAPVTLASAEAPFADPFLMEFEDSMALKQAYSEAPVTFEQALLAARLEAKNAAEQGTRRTVVKSVAADLALGSLLDADLADPSTVPSADPSAAPVLKTARTRGNADETMAEPAATAALSAARIARIRPQQGAAQVFSGLNVKVMGVVQPNKIAPAAQKCFVLGYNQGYANLSTPHYLAVKNTANKGACCSLCQRDSRCVAWTRVAAARDDVRTCYLKDTLQRDPDIMAYAYSYAPPYLHQDYPEVRYIVDALPVMLESGTKHMALPQEVYGCPYPPVPGQPPGSCSAPQTCNCHRGICYGSCRGGLAGEQRRM